MAQRCASDKDVIELVLGRAQVNQFVDIVLHAGFAEHGVRDDAARDPVESKAVGASSAVEMIGRFSSAGTRHVLKRDCRVSWDVLGKHRRQRFGAKIAHAPGTSADDKRDRLALIKGRLRTCRTNPQPEESRR
jgi:hypothetical protein